MDNKEHPELNATDKEKSDPEEDCPTIETGNFNSEPSSFLNQFKSTCHEQNSDNLQNDVQLLCISSDDDCLKEADGQIDDKEFFDITLTDMPTEVLLQICSYLSARFLMGNLKLVCKRLHDILSDDFIWKSRIFKQCSQSYPPMPDEVNWKAACVHLEEQQERWSNMQSSMKHRTWQDVHISSVDAITLLNKGRLCVSGSRDRTIAVWNVDAYHPHPIIHDTTAHQGWIWGLAPLSYSTFCSCSWDNHAKIWSLEDGRLSLTKSFSCDAAALSVAGSENMIVVGTYNKSIYIFDPRAGDCPVGSYITHKGSVLKLALLQENGSHFGVVSISSDQTLAVWDLKAGKTFKENVKIGKRGGSYSPFPLSMSLNSDMLYVGDSRGQLHLIDPRLDSATSFQVLASYDAGHKLNSKISAVQHCLGSIMTGSSDGSIRVSTTTHSPKLITSFQAVGTEVASLDFQHGILAVGSTNCALELWIPEEISA